MVPVARHSLPKSARLREEQFFRELLSARQKISTPFFSIRYKSNAVSYPRLGIVSPKKKFVE